MKKKPTHPKVLTIMERAARRRHAMQTYRDLGWSLAKIAREYKVSWQRVQQILNPGKRPRRHLGRRDARRT